MNNVSSAVLFIRKLTNNKNIMVSIPNDFAPSYAQPPQMNNKKQFAEDDITITTTVFRMCLNM